MASKQNLFAHPHHAVWLWGHFYEKCFIFPREYNNDRWVKKDCPQAQNTSVPQLASVFGGKAGCEGCSPALWPLCYKCRMLQPLRQPRTWEASRSSDKETCCSHRGRVTSASTSVALLRHHWPVQLTLTCLSETSKVCKWTQAVKSLVLVSCWQQNYIGILSLLKFFRDGIPKSLLGGGDPLVATHMEAFSVSNLINSPLDF